METSIAVFVTVIAPTRRRRREGGQISRKVGQRGQRASQRKQRGRQPAVPGNARECAQGDGQQQPHVLGQEHGGDQGSRGNDKHPHVGQEHRGGKQHTPEAGQREGEHVRREQRHEQQEGQQQKQFGAVVDAGARESGLRAEQHDD